jgi:hypothetical protein
MSQKTQNKNNKPKLLSAVFVVVIAAIAIVYFIQHGDNTQQTQSTTSAVKTASTTVPTKGTPTTDNGTTNSGGVQTTPSTTTSTLPPESEWTTSSSGNITLQQPTANMPLASGDTITGLANVSTVQFILKDSQVGEIAQGSMNVTNGKFSGTLQFTPHASSGTLEVFYADPTDGAEKDIININVAFNT